jgi:lipid A 3-O-deacylase
MKKLALLLSIVAASSAFGGQSALHPTDRWEFVFETGFLRNVGNNTAIDYEIIPTQLTFRSPTMWNLWDAQNGGRLVVRNRFSGVFESIIKGPEDYYLGVSAAPSLEYWFPSQETSLFFSIGGGVGVTNSAGGEEGQGQDFTLNWFSQLGIRQQITPDLSILGGLYFVHHSNGGQTEPNPGIDALGLTIGLGWQF